MRKLRAYKGVWYGPDTQRWQCEGIMYRYAANVITSLPFMSDDDHPELMRLKAEPYEPMPRLEDVIESAYEEWRGGYSRTGHKELIAWRIRQSFPHIDQEGS